jgi:hypothetical protein
MINFFLLKLLARLIRLELFPLFFFEIIIKIAPKFLKVEEKHPTKTELSITHNSCRKKFNFLD